ncbi:MAG: PQQ-binding-like beta-propeller repeat protein [Myxococcota bacterium]
MFASCFGVRAERHLASAPRAVMQFAWTRVLTEHGYDVYRPRESAVATVDARGERHFIGSTSGVFLCLRARDGAELWKVATDGPIASRPLEVDRLGVVYFGSDDGHLYAVGAADGRVLWRYATKGTVRQPPVYDAGVLYFVTSEERVYAVEARTGRWRWHYERGLPEGFTIDGQSGLTLARGRLYAGFADGVVVALDGRSGELLWLRSLGVGDERYVDADGTPRYDAERDAIYASAYSGGVYALDPDDGSVRWRFEARGPSAPRLADGVLYFTAAEDGVYAIDRDGRVLWRQTMRRGLPAAPVPAGDYLFVSTAEGGLFAIARRDGRLLALFPPGGGISAEPVVASDRLYVLSNNGRLYAALLGERL